LVVSERAVWDALEVICAVEFLVERDAGLMRGFELDLVAHHHGGDGDPRCAAQDHET